ncbi:MAG: translocation protein TolB [bacterium]
MSIVRILFLASLMLVSTLSGYAQINREQFGKNRVQYKNFNWRYYSSDNFDVYFYEGGEDNALIAAKFLEKEFERITDIIGYAPYSKTKIFLYNSNKDLLQSNVGVGGAKYTVGGQTDFVKAQVETAYPGNMIDFEQELVRKISEMLINDMMFGGSLTDMFQSAYLLSLPSWFIQGAARYIADGWSIEMDDFMREQFVDNKKGLRLNKLTGDEAALAGQSVWNFIAVRYGRSSISNILNLTRIIRNEESSIVNTLGIPYRIFLRQWQSYYSEMAAQVNENYVFPDEDERIRKNNRRDYNYREVVFSPDGNFVAYSENLKGRYHVMIRNLKTGKTKTVHKAGYKVIDQPFDSDVPLLSWNNNQTLGIIGHERGKNYLWLYNMASKDTRRITLTRFNQVKGFDFNDNGRLAVMSADLNGQNDIYLYNPNRNTFSRITNDIYDDLYPSFIPGTDKIVFSSNRPEDSLYYQAIPPRELELSKEIDDNFNIFIYSGEPTDSLLTRVTNTISTDIKPIPKDEKTIFYLSDQRGIYNVYKYELEDSLFNQVTNFALSIQDYDIDFSKNSLAYVMLSDEEDYVHLEPNFDTEQSIFTPKTIRQEAIQAKIISERIANNKKRKEENPPPSSLNTNDTLPRPLTDDVVNVLPDSMVVDSLDQELLLEEPSPVLEDTLINTDDYDFDSEAPPLTDAGEEIIDTENYEFSLPEETVAQEDLSPDNFNFEEEKTDPVAQNSFLSRYRKLQRETRITGPLPYETRFSADNIVTSLTVDPLRDFGFHVQVQMNDLLENHRFYGGIVQYVDLRSGNVFAEYEYIKNRIDYRARYERNGYFLEDGDRTVQKYTKNVFEFGAALPFNITSRFEMSPFYTNTNFIDLSQVTAVPGSESQSSNHFSGIRAGFVFDNTLVTGFKNFQGTKARAFFTHHQGMNDADLSFSNIEVDVRHYQKLWRDITFASRLFYGNFFGRNAQSYLLGGLNNWLFNRVDSPEENDPLAITRDVDNSNILFTEFVDLRGFNFNKLQGTDVMTFSAELRLPIVRFFYRGPIASNFFRNLEFAGFYDVGSSWTGASPFNERNSLNTEVIVDGPFRAEIQNFKNPWLQSYGAGVRTVLLGYYLKFDVAYPIEDNIVAERPRFFLSLGYDF